MLGFVYYDKDKLPTTADTLIKVMTSVGTLFGQIFFGAMADLVGRKRMYGWELSLVIIATLGQCLAARSDAVSVVGLMVFWRVILGLGIGGDYPLSNVIMSEYVVSPVGFIEARL